MRRKTSIRSLSWSLSLAFVIGSAVSCSQNKPPSEANFAGSGHLAAAGHGDSSSGILPPKDARWTIYCQAIGGVDHVERANQAKAELLKRKDLKDWYVVHQETESVIYYGFYRSINDPKDPKETRRAQFDHQRLLAMTDNQGNRLLSQCLFV